ncbi:uncharacterized protein FIESC28_01660 [Fusarium coffeatum]|uniref:Metallo-beta-lactamase domain-containing protein n=1 Tax=Fusarium coffeatum TaxID=231269 RepID=A0A366S8N0_9HYPO|nr:uncharacterized protein FIESC28_01660 [Fusarium coffeatum]RBR25697.1 hypothetical protein FIESC28_01660 [Fusarium coffeatum]
MTSSGNLCLCVTCGTQYDIPFVERPSTCRMCNEPRQFVPPSGQSWTTLEELQTTHKNEFKQDQNDKRIWSIFSTPQVAIGQRAVFIQTESGNVLWDCISLLDQETINFIKSHGGLAAIAISHPHFYSTHLEWAREFDCPVYLAYDDQEWLNRKDTEHRRILFRDETQEILPGVTMIKLGGHFPGSSVLHWNNNISRLNRLHHTKDHQVFFFHYAFSNFIPLGPTAMHLMWNRLRPWHFTAVYSLFFRTTVREPNVKDLILESMQRQAKHQENTGHPLLEEQPSA